MVVVQVGIWLGLSALYLADLLPPGGTMYAVDTWLRSEEEHTPRAEEAALLPRLYQQFLSNVIHQKLTHVVIPIRMQSLEAAAALDITPNLIYLDVEPNQKSVYNDLVLWSQKITLRLDCERVSRCKAVFQPNFFCLNSDKYPFSPITKK